MFSSCFGGSDEPPEIELDMTSDVVSAPMMDDAIPMPSPSELKTKFAELVVSNIKSICIIKN